MPMEMAMAMAMAMVAAADLSASAAAVLSSAPAGGVFWVVELRNLNHLQIQNQMEEWGDLGFLSGWGQGFGCEPSSRSPQRRSSFRCPLL